MDKILEIFRKPLIVLIAGFVVGVIVGLPVLGWTLWPVQYYDAAPKDLRSDLKADYLRMVIDSYALNKNQALARNRWTELGPDAALLLKQLSTDTNVTSENYLNFSNLVQVPSVGLGTTSPTGMASWLTPTPIATPAGNTSGLTKFLPYALGVSCVFMLVVGGVLAYLLLMRNRKQVPGTRISPAQSIKQTVPPPPVGYVEDNSEAPVARFMTTYTLGDDLYDDSFSIDAASGEFLGECGVGISHVIGMDEPKKVTAFEVWLFDKNDVQTVTKVLMSPFALNDPEIRQTLAAKGEPVSFEPGKMIMLDTATLQLEARVIDMNYGQSSLPQNSFLDRLTLELAVWQKVNA